jgi:hypothetical protein
VKLAHSPAAQRGQKNDLRRDRDMAPLLRAMFPKLQHLRIELRFAGPGSNVPTAQTHRLYPPARAFFEYRCPYSDCDGRFQLDDAVRIAVNNAAHRAQGVMECNGSRGQDLSARRACLLQLDYHVTADCQPTS